ERLTVEFKELLLHKPAHHVAGVIGMDAISIPPLEPVSVEEGHEELEVGILARVRSSREKQEVPRDAAKELPQLVPLGFLDLVGEEVGRHLVSLVDHYEVPFSLFELR